ncbi:MAG: hypothetical protein NZ765_04570 [Anaerolineae bacterium]|nr:hypothetical protein [Anaerolineae bacterium]MDW8070841.1 hypothetical protein [Anaerolineae bacterium]
MENLVIAAIAELLVLFAGILSTELGLSVANIEIPADVTWLTR